MPLRWNGAAGGFQGAEDDLLTKIKCQVALVHLDDTAIIAQTPDSHIHHVWQLLRLFYNAGMRFNVKKCKFLQITLMTSVISLALGALKVSTWTIEAIRGLEHPINLTELRSLVGLCSVCRRFDPNFARVATLLNNELRKDPPADLWRSSWQRNNSLGEAKG